LDGVVKVKMPSLHGVFELRQAPMRSMFPEKGSMAQGPGRAFTGDTAYGRPENILTLFFSCPLYYRIFNALALQAASGIQSITHRVHLPKRKG
jgi:hypothetical protein